MHRRCLPLDRDVGAHTCRSRAAYACGHDASVTLSEFVFPEPWLDLRGHAGEDAQQRNDLAEQLRIELAPGHQLHGQRHSTIARCTACDQVLFDLGGGRFATVHLTWTGSPPDRPPWPASTIYGSWRHAAQAVLDHEPGWT